MVEEDKSERWQRELRAAPPFGEALGARLRAIREGAQPPRTTEDIASAARLFGLTWHRTTVGHIERGTRAVTAVELLLLPRIYAVPFRSLLPAQTVWITDSVAVSAAALWRSITEEKSLWWPDSPGGWSTEAGRQAEETSVEDMHLQVGLVRAALDGQWPKGPVEHRATPDEAEVKAAAKLSSTPHYVTYAARLSWGHGLSAERDQRLGERGDLPAGKRAIQAARGHVTRALLKELEPVVRQLEDNNVPDELIRQLDPADLGPIRFGRGDDGS